MVKLRICRAWKTTKCRWNGVRNDQDKRCPHSIAHYEQSICEYGSDDHDYGCPVCESYEENLFSKSDFEL